MWGLGGAELSTSKPPTASGGVAGPRTVTVTVTSEAHGSLLQDGRGGGYRHVWLSVAPPCSPPLYHLPRSPVAQFETDLEL